MCKCEYPGKKPQIAVPTEGNQVNESYIGHTGHASTLPISCVSVLLRCLSIPSYSWNKGLILKSQFVSNTFSYFFSVCGLVQNFTQCFGSLPDPQAMMLQTRTSERSLAVLAPCPRWWVVLAVKWACHRGLWFICAILAKKSLERCSADGCGACAGCIGQSIPLPSSLPEPLYNCLCSTARFAGCVKKLLVRGISQVFK